MSKKFLRRATLAGLDDGGVTLVGSEHVWNVKSLDTVFVSPWTSVYGPTVWPAPLAPIPRSPGIRGMAFPITNNVWNTNFIYWYPYIEEDRNFKTRYQVFWSNAVFKNSKELKFHPKLPIIF